MNVHFWVGILWIGPLLHPIACEAASFDPQPFPNAVQTAPVIARGKIGMIYSDWGVDSETGTHRIYTYVELQISEVFKGSIQSPTVTMRELGGEKEGVELTIPGTSHFQRGEDVVIFLREKNSEGTFDVHGMEMGKYNVVPTADPGELLEGPGLYQSQWTIESLRQLIHRQEIVKNPTPQESPSPTPPSRPPIQTQPDRAPQSVALSSFSSESPFPILGERLFILGLTVTLLWLLWVILRRRKKRR